MISLIWIFQKRQIYSQKSDQWLPGTEMGERIDETAIRKHFGMMDAQLYKFIENIKLYIYIGYFMVCMLYLNKTIEKLKTEI